MLSPSALKQRCVERETQMTNEEAIKLIELAMAEVEWEYSMEYSVAFELAIKALKEQINKELDS